MTESLDISITSQYAYGFGPPKICLYRGNTVHIKAGNVYHLTEMSTSGKDVLPRIFMKRLMGVERVRVRMKKGSSYTCKVSRSSYQIEHRDGGCEVVINNAAS
jgi:hypothetical protein